MAEQRLDLRQLLRGLPVVSLGLGVSLLAVFLVVELGFTSRREAARRDIRLAVDMALEYPMLDLEPRFEPAVRYIMPSFDGNEMFDFLRDAPVKQGKLDAMVARGFAQLDSHPYRSLGVVPAQFSPVGFVSHLWLHAGWVHVFATIAMILVAGPLLERVWGSRLFAAALVPMVAASAGVFALVHAGGDRSLIGGAGLVSGLIAAVVVRFRGETINFVHWLARVEVAAPAWGIAGVWVVYEGALSWAVPGALPGGLDNAVGYTAHAAGGLTGALVALGIARSGLEARLCAPTPAAARRRAEPKFDLDRVRMAHQQGDLETALRMLRVEVQRSARNRDAVLMYWEISRESNEAKRAAPAMIQLIREELRRGALPAAVSHWSMLADGAPDARLEIGLMLQLIPVIREERGDEVAVAALRQAWQPEAGELGAESAARLAVLAADLAPDLARRAAKRGLAAGEQAPGVRATLESLAAPEPELAANAPERPLPPNAFYEEQDRSQFGAVGDLSELDDGADAPGDPLFPEVVVTEAVPLALDETGVDVYLSGKGKARLAYPHVRAVSMAGVCGLGERPVVLVDLLITGPEPDGKPLQLVRLRSDQFDPRQVVPTAAQPLDALKSLVSEIQKRARVDLLPKSEAGSGPRIEVFDTLDDYQLWALRVAPPSRG